jgi:ferrous iron transport protein B
MLMPFFSCGAKAPIWAMFAAALFPRHGDVVIFGVYMTGISTAILAGILLKTFVFKKDAVPFIMELPAYHVPGAKNVAMDLWNNLRNFLVRASTLIAGSMVVIWFLSNYSFSLSIVEPGGSESILGSLGAFLQPLFAPLGFASGHDGWKAVVAILTGFVAMEMVVSTMGVLYSELGPALAANFSPVAACSFMAFNLLSIPCMAAVATANGEMKSPKWMLFSLAFWVSAAWIMSLAIFQAGTLLASYS